MVGGRTYMSFTWAESSKGWEEKVVARHKADKDQDK